MQGSKKKHCLVRDRIPEGEHFALLAKHGLAASNAASGYNFRYKDNSKAITSKILSILPALSTYLAGKHPWLKNLQKEDVSKKELPFVLLGFN